ncbi:MAG TPA: hypothetical protein VFH70_06130 [Acidimicrobiales bacterium]|nr:hypothetical protein [Acidimicrobiales bacterium]
MGNWIDWHDAYEHPGSSLSRRLEVVRERLRTALDGAGPSPTVLSLCSGDGRDVIGTLTGRPTPTGRVVLVEADEDLAERARRMAEVQNLTQVEVRCRDAGAVESFIDVVPVDVLLLCGIFGNIDHPTVKRVVEAVPGLVRTGGYVIWTRGGSEPDRRPEIRGWFAEAGMEEVAFDGAPEPYGVGLNRVTIPGHSPGLGPERLFSFR